MMKFNSESGQKLIRLLQDEFQVPKTSTRVVVTIDVHDRIRVTVDYLPQQIEVAQSSEEEFRKAEQKFCEILDHVGGKA